MIDVAAAGDVRPPPGAGLGADVDEVDQGRSGPHLEHSILRQRAINGAADDVAIENLGRLHVVDEEDDMIEPHKGERRRSGHESNISPCTADKKGEAEASPFPQSRCSVPPYGRMTGFPSASSGASSGKYGVSSSA